jgi:hypothetical protein
MNDLLYRIRAKISPMWGGGTRFVALGGVAVGIVLITDDYTAIGASLLVASVPVSWLTGMWMVPGSVDAYFVKMSSIMTEASTNLYSENVWLRRQLGDIATAVDRLEPSQTRVDVYRRIVTDIGLIEEILDDKSIKFADRAVGLLRPSLSLRSVLSELESELSEPYVEPYVREMVSLLARYKHRVDESKERNAESLRRLVRRAEGVRRPGFLADRHRQYIQILNVYMSCMIAYYASTQDGIAGARRAAAAVEVAYVNLEDVTRDYFAELLTKSHRGHAGDGRIGVS